MMRGGSVVTFQYTIAGFTIAVGSAQGLVSSTPSPSPKLIPT